MDVFRKQTDRPFWFRTLAERQLVFQQISSVRGDQSTVAIKPKNQLVGCDLVTMRERRTVL